MFAKRGRSICFVLASMDLGGCASHHPQGPPCLRHFSRRCCLLQCINSHSSTHLKLRSSYEDEQQGHSRLLMATSARVVKLSPARLRVFFTRLPFITRLIFLISVLFGVATLIFSSLSHNAALIPSKVSIWSGMLVSYPGTKLD